MKTAPQDIDVPIEDQYPRGYHSCACPVTGVAHRLEPNIAGRYYRASDRTYYCADCHLKVIVGPRNLVPPVTYGGTPGGYQQPIPKRAQSPRDVQRAFKDSPASYAPPLMLPLSEKMPKQLYVLRHKEGDIVQTEDGRQVCVLPPGTAPGWMKSRWRSWCSKQPDHADPRYRYEPTSSESPHHDYD
jgi:hypothetical protein